MNLRNRLQSSPGLHYLGWRAGFCEARTQTTKAEQECLQEHARGRRRLLEIGVWHGVNTSRLRAVMAGDGVLFAVDPFPAGRLGVSWEKQIAHGEVSKVSNGEVKFLQMTSEEAAKQFNEGSQDDLDFVFIDGDHSYEGLQTDWSLWTPHVALGGRVALHDSRSCAVRKIDHVGSVRFTQEQIRHDDRFRVVDEVDSLTVVERVSGRRK